MKQLHEEMSQLIRHAPMSAADIAHTLGVSKRYIGLIIQAHRTHPSRMNYRIAGYERTSRAMIPLYRYGGGEDAPKPAAKTNAEIMRDWYKKNKVALRAKRMAKLGKKASPWDSLLNKC